MAKKTTIRTTKPISLAEKRASSKVVRAKYDAAQTSADNARHWVNADNLSANAAATADIREILRRRARYEIANNSYAKGIVLTLANDCVGTGPRLQSLTDDAGFNREIEAAFCDWSQQINFATKLRTMRMAKVGDGEAFGMLVANSNINGPAQLDIALVEADRIATPYALVIDSNTVDGIDLDEFGNPKNYYVLKNHPGDMAASITDFAKIDSRHMLHWFRADRPGQYRAVSELTPALPLFAQLRRYTLAVLAAAESVADFAAVLYTDAPSDGDAAEVAAMDTIDLEKRMATVLPDGWKLGQIKAEQPTTTYAEFKKEILNEIARCLNMPLNVALCNSAGYNYASGRLDHQTYYKSIRVEQAGCEISVVDRVFRAWLYEAMLSTDFAKLRRRGVMPHQWFWDGTEHVDPAKEANAQATRLKSHTTNLAAEYGKQGKDWETELYQTAKELKLMKELGLVEPVESKTQTGATDE